MAPQTVLHLERLLFSKRFEIRFEAMVEIIRVNTFRPGIPILLCHGTAAELKPAVVKVVAFGRGVGTPNHDRRLFYQGAVFEL